jgi:guanylate kinase
MSSKHKLLCNHDKGLLFVLSAPAGTGKTTLVNMLTNEFDCIEPSISYTSRQPRDGEVNGVSYHFISPEEFEQKIEKGDFLEYVKLYDHYYGTSREWVEKTLAKGKHVFLVIDTQGGLFLKGKFPAIYIFLMPPSVEELKNRLEKRMTEDEDTIEKRLSIVQEEMERGSHYDYHIINDDLNTAYQVLRSIVIAEEHRNRL